MVKWSKTSQFGYFLEKKSKGPLPQGMVGKWEGVVLCGPLSHLLLKSTALHWVLMVQWAGIKDRGMGLGPWQSERRLASVPVTARLLVITAVLLGRVATFGHGCGVCHLFEIVAAVLNGLF